MRRNRRRARAEPELTEVEFGILHTLKHKQNATAEVLRRELPWPVDGFSVRAGLLRLEERSRITHVIHSGQIFYRPAKQSQPAEVNRNEASTFGPHAGAPL
jgi:hypothetical protein